MNDTLDYEIFTLLGNRKKERMDINRRCSIRIPAVEGKLNFGLQFENHKKLDFLT